MATYRTVEPAVERDVRALIDGHFPDLREAGITLCLLYAHAPRGTNDEPKGPALKFANWPAAALVKINPLRDRVAGLEDATICLDGDTWDSRSEAERLAILDHELNHLEVRRDEEGAVLLDDACRPRLRLRPHDWQHGGFDEIVKRHGEAALESQAALMLGKKMEQLLMAWAK